MKVNSNHLRKRSGRRVRDRVKSVSTSILVFALVIAVWEAGVRLGDVPATILPTPSAVFVALREGVLGGRLVLHSLVTLQEIVYGFVLGGVIGVGLGILVAEIRWVRRLVYPYIVATQAVPKVALAPLFLIWFGFGLTSKVLLAVTITFFPVLVNTIQGLDGAQRDQLDLLRAYCASRSQIFFRVKLPTAVPFIFAGLEIAVVLSVIAAIVAEFVSATSGLGYLILQENLSLNMPGVFAALTVLSVLGYLLHGLVKVVHRRAVFWREIQGNEQGI